MTAPRFPAGERLIRITRQHWVRYVFSVFVYLLLASISLLLFVLAGLSAHHYVWLSQTTFAAALTLFLVTHHWFFLMLVREASSYVVLTNRRVVWIRDSLFLTEDMAEFAFERMTTVEAHKQGILQTVLRYGTLRFEGRASIPLVPHPNSVAKDIEQAMGMR